MKQAAAGAINVSQLQAMQGRVASLMAQYDVNGPPLPSGLPAQSHLPSATTLPGIGGLSHIPPLGGSTHPGPIGTLPSAVPVPSAAAPPLPPQPADQSMQWAQNQKGELQKAEQAAKTAAASSGCFVGIVSRWSNASGVGHIECKEASQKHGADVQILRPQFGDLQISDTVLFQVAALDGQGGPPKAAFARRIGQLTEQRRQILEVEVPYPAAGTADSPQEYLGFISSFAAAAGYGFISCAQTRQLYGAEVYIHRDQYVDSNVGDAVHFRVALNSKGAPVARQVKKAMPSSGAPVSAPKQVAKRSRSRSMSESMSISGERKASKSTAAAAPAAPAVGAVPAQGFSRTSSPRERKKRSKSRSRSRRRRRRSRS